MSAPIFITYIFELLNNYYALPSVDFNFTPTNIAVMEAVKELEH